MIGPLHPFRALAGAAGGLRDDLVPGTLASHRHEDGLRDQVRQLSAAWSIAFLAQICAAGLIARAAKLLGHPAIIDQVALFGGIIGLCGVILLAAVKLPFTRSWSPHVHVRIATLCAAGVAVGLVSFLSIAALFPVGNYRLAGFVAVFGTIIITVVALHPMRAATLGFATALVATIGARAGPGSVFAVGIAFLLALAVATYRLARLDRASAETRDRAAVQGRMAARLVGEFEEHSTGWFWQTDSQGRVTYLSAKVSAELDLPDTPAIGAPLTTLFRVDSASPETERTLAFHLSSRTAFSNYSVRPVSASKLERWWSISGRPIADELGRFQGFIGSGSDLTERRRADAEITRLALFDGLTGLANRQRMRMSLDQTLSQPGGAHRSSALFLLDLDRFKAVNDTLGHQTGDALLKQVAQRLQRSIGDAGLVGRLGGDEFQVILPGEARREQLAALGTEVIASLSQPYFIDGSSITVGCSIGIAIAPDHGNDAETLVRNADLALYAAKADGRGIHRFFREELLVGAQSRKQLEDDLRHALVQDQLTSPISRWSAPRPSASSGTRRWCAGTIRRAVRCRRPSSSPWPRTPG